MTEEVFIRTEADALTQRIVDRLGERQKKLNRIAEWEQPARRMVLRPLKVTLAVAACLTVAFFLVPLLRSTSPLDTLAIETPMIEEYRSSTLDIAEINRLIETKNYDDALLKTEQMLQHSKREVKMLEKALVNNNDEVLQYELEAERAMNAQVHWTYIYLLIRVERNDDALRELKIYLKIEGCPNREQAKALLKELQ